MKLFRRAPFRPSKNNLGLKKRSKRSGRAPIDEPSIGSELSEADQFDILIPIRSRRHGRDDEKSEISSLSTDDRRRQRNQDRRTQPESSTKSSVGGGILTTCCFGEAATTINTNDSIVDGGATQATQITDPPSTCSLFDWVCCAGSNPNPEVTEPVKREQARDSVAPSLVPTNSLFDSVLDDEEQEQREDQSESRSTKSRKKKWKLRALPWRRTTRKILAHRAGFDSRQLSACAG
jgi:hypothetical protein